MLRLKNLTGGIPVPTGTSPQSRHATLGGPAEPTRLAPHPVPPGALEMMRRRRPRHRHYSPPPSRTPSPNATNPEHPRLEFTS